MVIEESGSLPDGHASFTTAGQILTELILKLNKTNQCYFFLGSTSAQVKIQFRPFLKFFFRFPCCSTCEDLSIDVSILSY